MIPNPWEKITIPEGGLIKKLINPELKWDLYWAKDINSNYLLVFDYDNLENQIIKPPKLKGISIDDIKHPEGKSLTVKLHNKKDWEIFYKLCIDISTETDLANNEEDALNYAIKQTWRWHHLLRGGSSDLLSLENQKGLIGELIIFRDILSPNLGYKNSLNSWKGPEDATWDFEVNGNFIESKCKNSGSKPFIYINSEYQLENKTNDSLYIYVSEIHRANKDSENSFNLNSLCKSIMAEIIKIDANDYVHFDALLYAYGFNWEHNYSEYNFIEGTHNIYRIDDSFPKITSQKIQEGISDVKYKISLRACEKYLIEKKILIEKIKDLVE